MGTKIIVGKRRSGKTTDAIKESAATGRYILVPNRAMALNLADYAQELGVHIPFPINEKINRDAFDATLYSLERSTDPWTKL